jgi:hypothetical protein
MWKVATQASVRKGDIELTNPLQPDSSKDLKAARTIQHCWQHRQEKQENDINVLPPSTIVKAITAYKKTLLGGAPTSDTNGIFKIELYDTLKLNYEVRRTYKSFAALAEIANRIFPQVHLLSVPKFASPKALGLALRQTLSNIIKVQKTHTEKNEGKAIDMRIQTFNILTAKFCRLSDLEMGVNDFEDFIVTTAERKAKSKLNFKRLVQPVVANATLAKPVRGNQKRSSLIKKKTEDAEVGDVERTGMARANTSASSDTNFFTLAELFIDFVQKVTLIVLVDVDWPSPFVDVAQYLGVLSFDFGPLFGSLTDVGAAWARLVAMLSIHPFLITFFVIFMMCNTEEYRKSWMRRNYTNWDTKSWIGIRRPWYLFGCWALPCACMVSSIFIRPKLASGNWNYHFSLGLTVLWTMLCAFWQVPIYIKRYYLRSWVNIAGDGGENLRAKEVFWEHLGYYQARIFGLLYAATFLAGVRVVLGTWVEAAKAAQFQEEDGPKTELMMLVGIGACMFVLMLTPVVLLLAVYYRKGFKLVFDSDTGFKLQEGEFSGLEYEPKAGAFSVNSHGVLSSPDRFPTCVLPFKLAEGSCYFEVEIIEVGEMPQLGFADSRFEIGANEGVGDDDHSWAVDGGRVMTWPQRRFGRKWKKGDVVGFLAAIDSAASTATIKCSLNGDYDEPMGVAFEDVDFVGFLQPAFTLGGGTRLRIHLNRRNFRYPSNVQAIPMPETWLARMEATVSCGNVLQPQERTKRVLRLCSFLCVIAWAGAILLPALLISSSAGVGVYAVILALAIIAIIAWAVRLRYYTPTGGQYSVGDFVEADFNGNGEYRPGKIERIRSNGSYTVVGSDPADPAFYTDEYMLEADSIRLVPNNKGKSVRGRTATFARVKSSLFRLFAVGVLVLAMGMFCLLYFSMGTSKSKIDALLVFSGFAAVPYFFFPPLVLYYASLLAYKYLQQQCPLHFSRMDRMKNSLDRAGSSLRSFMNKSSAKDESSKPLLSRSDSRKLKRTRDKQYHEVLEAQKALGFDKPLQQGGLAMMRPPTRHENNDQDEGFKQSVRIARVVHSSSKAGADLYDCIATTADGRYFRQGKKLKQEVYLDVSGRNLQRVVEHDDVMILLQKSMISFIHPFEPDRYWFKTYVLLEKLVLASITVLSFGHLRVQCTVLVSVGVLGLLVSIFLSPYMHWMEDGADMVQRFASLIICLVPYLIDVGVLKRAEGNMILFGTIVLVFAVILYCLQLGSMLGMVRSFFRSQAVLGAVKEIQKRSDHSKMKGRSSYVVHSPGNAGHRILRYLQYQVHGRDLKAWKALDKAYLVMVWGDKASGHWNTKELSAALVRLKLEGKMPRKIEAAQLLMRTETDDNYRMALGRQATFTLAASVKERKATMNTFQCIDLHFMKEQPPAKSNVRIDADLIVDFATRAGDYTTTWGNGHNVPSLKPNHNAPVFIFLPLWLVKQFIQEGTMDSLEKRLHENCPAGAGRNMLYLGSIMQKEAYLQTYLAHQVHASGSWRSRSGTTTAPTETTTQPEMTVNLEFSALRVVAKDMEDISEPVWRGVLEDAKKSWPGMTRLFTPKPVTRMSPELFPRLFDAAFGDGGGSSPPKYELPLKVLHSGAFASQKELEMYQGLVSTEETREESISLMDSFSTESSTLHSRDLTPADTKSSSEHRTFVVSKTNGETLAKIRDLVSDEEDGWKFPVSPNGPLTLPKEVKAQLFIPEEASSYCFAYPLQHLKLLDRTAKYMLTLNKPDANFLAFGGYMYFDANDKVVATNALSYRSDVDSSSKASFRSALDCSAEIESKLREAGRFEKPDHNLEIVGVSGYTWIHAGEFESKAFVNRHGGFVFVLKIDGKSRCLAFLLTDGSDASHHVGGDSSGNAVVSTNHKSSNYKLKVVTKLPPQAEAELQSQFGHVVDTIASNWKVMYDACGAERMAGFVSSFMGMDISAVTDSPSDANAGIDYSSLTGYSGCMGLKLESFLAKDVVSGAQFASHVLLSHPNFCNRPTCLLFYTTW